MQIQALDRDRVLSVALEGKTFREIAAAAGTTVHALFKAMEDAQFRGQIVQARDSGIDVMVDEIMTIAKDESIPVDRARLLCDNIKWIAARRAHRRYGDRIDMNINQSIDIAGTLLEARTRTLQPIRHQQDALDVQDADYVDVSSTETTDKESATSEPSIFD